MISIAEGEHFSCPGQNFEPLKTFPTPNWEEVKFSNFFVNQLSENVFGFGQSECFDNFETFHCDFNLF